MAGFALRKRFTCFPKLPVEVRLLVWEFALPGPRLVNIRQRPVKKTFLDYEEEHGIEWPRGAWWDMDSEDEDNDSELLDQFLLQARLDLRTWVCRKAGVRGYDQRVFWDSHMLGISSNCPPPEITYVCRESYEVVSRHYTRAFAYPESIAGTYFNFELDTLYLRWDDFTHYFHCMGLNSMIDGLTGNFQLVDQETLRKVRKLAIMPHPDYTSDSMDAFLDALLSTFNGLKELSLVVWDYGLDWIQNYPPEPGREGEESMVDALYLPEAIRAYYIYRQEILRGELPELRLPMQGDAGKFIADIERFKRTWTTLNKTDKSSAGPSILPRVIVTPRIKKDLDLAERLYKLALENSEEAKARDNLHAVGFELEDMLSDDDFDDF